MYQILLLLLGVGAGVLFLTKMFRGSRRSHLDGEAVSEEWRRELRRQRDDG
jgi:hypothetical protein